MYGESCGVGGGKSFGTTRFFRGARFSAGKLEKRDATVGGRSGAAPDEWTSATVAIWPLAGQTSKNGKEQKKRRFFFPENETNVGALRGRRDRRTRVEVSILF